MKLYTITLNPAYDVHAYSAQFAPFCENHAQVRTRDAGGKGVNLSRALQAAGVANTAIVVLGSENAAEFRSALCDLDCLFFEKEGRIRENLTLHHADGTETRISFSGFSVAAELLDEIRTALQIDDDTIITFTGSLPNGLAMDAVMRFLADCKQKGARIVLDSRSFSLEDLYALQPWLIKPNQEEISAYFGEAVETMAQAIEKATVFYKHGIANAMISLGAQGALLICDGGVFVAEPPKIQVVSTIGAGDSSIAGFLSVADASPDIRLKTAVAFGTAACLTEGSQPPQKDMIERILPQIEIKKDGV